MGGDISLCYIFEGEEQRWTYNWFASAGGLSILLFDILKTALDAKSPDGVRRAIVCIVI